MRTTPIGTKRLRVDANEIGSFPVDAGARTRGRSGPGFGAAEFARAAHRPFVSEKGRQWRM